MAKHDMARVFIDRNGDGPTVIRRLNAIARELGHPTGRPDTSEGYSIWVTVETFKKWQDTGPKKQPKKTAKKAAPKSDVDVDVTVGEA